MHDCILLQVIYVEKANIAHLCFCLVIDVLSKIAEQWLL